MIEDEAMKEENRKLNNLVSELRLQLEGKLVTDGRSEDQWEQLSAQKTALESELSQKMNQTAGVTNMKKMI